MKEKILEILNNPHYSKSAEDITAMVFDLMEWTATNVYIKGLTGKIGIIDTDLILNDWNEVSNYWLNNVKK